MNVDEDVECCVVWCDVMMWWCVYDDDVCKCDEIMNNVMYVMMNVMCVLCVYVFVSELLTDVIKKCMMLNVKWCINVNWMNCMCVVCVVNVETMMCMCVMMWNMWWCVWWILMRNVICVMMCDVCVWCMLITYSVW